jgi:hypothetical protein
MAHFAEIGPDNIVIRVLVVPDEQEHRAQEYMADDLGLGGTWIQTSYWTNGGVHYGPDNEPDGGTPLHYNYAGTGAKWDAENGAFYSAAGPHPSWVLNETTFRWEAPTPYPVNGNPHGYAYAWDEDTTSWVVPNQPAGGTEYRYDHDADEWVEVTE